MATYKIEALWDCIYCDTKEIKGGIRSCPNCGHVRADDVKFYLPKDISFANAVSDDKKVSEEPDWFCKFCETYNGAEVNVCKNCGIERDSSNSSYMDIQLGREK